MLLTCKAFAEGGRALVYYLSQFADVVAKGENVDEGLLTLIKCYRY